MLGTLGPFSKELKVVLLYSIKTVVSHLKRDHTDQLEFGGKIEVQLAQ